MIYHEEHEEHEAGKAVAQQEIFIQISQLKSIEIQIY
jgi:hypothetical protein